MAKYLVQFSYTEAGLKGLMKDGGSKRREVVDQLAKSLGAKLEAFYYAFGDYDGIAIFDGTDNVGMTAASLTVNVSGAAKIKTTVLLTPDEVDQAVKKTPSYRPPGQ
jgi:uncharacterized protein with GYD domain